MLKGQFWCLINQFPVEKCFNCSPPLIIFGNMNALLTCCLGHPFCHLHIHPISDLKLPIKEVFCVTVRVKFFFCSQSRDIFRVTTILRGWAYKKHKTAPKWAKQPLKCVCVLLVQRERVLISPSSDMTHKSLEKRDFQFMCNRPYLCWLKVPSVVPE